MKRKIIQIFSFMMAFILFLSCPLSVYASEKWEGSLGLTLYYNLEDVKQYIKETAGFWPYAFSQIGAIFKGNNWKQFMENYEKMDELLDGNVGLYKENENSSVKGVFLSKEFMAQLKALLEEYLKTEQSKEENGGFYLLPTIKFTNASANKFANSFQYQTFRNIVLEKDMIVCRIRDMTYVDLMSDPEHPKQFYFTFLSTPDSYLEEPDGVVYASFMCANDWQLEKTLHPKMKFPEDNKVYKSLSEASTVDNGYIDTFSVNAFDWYNYCLYSTTGEYVRVFVSMNAAKNYSVGNRKVFVTQNFYDYEPEDLTVSIDDLQKSVDDLQKIIDELLKKINDNTSEKEIEELLRLILEELRNSCDGGGGSGSGDVTVNVDLKETNNWLSKIYDKVSQIFDKVSTSAGQSMSEVVESIESLEKTLKKYLSEITGDLDDIKGQLKDMSEDEFNERSDSFLKDTTESFSEISEVAKTKFPFSIPNDLRLLIAKMTPSSSDQETETEAALYSVDTYGDISLYSGEHGGGGASRDEDEDKGGSGASRPASGQFISVEHGGGGGSRGSAEIKNGAPVFCLPFVIERYGIEEYVIIDMAPFEPVSKLSRSLFAIMFMLCLINLTFKTMGLWGDLVG